MKKYLPIALSAAVLALTLTGCAPAVELACPEHHSGKQVEQISVENNEDSAPTVSFATPINSEDIQTKVIVEGSGPVFTGRNLIEFEFAAYNGGTGELVQASSFDGTGAATGFFGPDRVPNFCPALAGVKEGSTVVALIPPADAHNSQGVPQLGVSETDSFVVVFAIKKVFPAQAEGDAQLPQAGMPTVVTTPEGIPGVTMPKTEAPTELKVAQLIKGRGEVIKKGQKVTLHYSGFLWSDGTKFDSSWDNDQPVQFEMTDGGLIKGFLDAVVGQPVGSRVLAVIPPALGYGDTPQGTIPANSTLVFVIDILGTSD